MMHQYQLSISGVKALRWFISILAFMNTYMTKFFIGITLFLSFCSCQSQVPPDGSLSKEALLEDLAQLRSILEGNHPQLYRFTSRGEFEQLYDDAEAALNGELTIADVFKPFARIVGAVGCGHTRINLPDQYWTDHRDGYLPLQVQIVDGQVFVVRCTDAGASIPTGAIISAINGHSMEDLLSDLRLHSTGDGLWHSLRDAGIVRYFSHRIAAVFDYPDEYILSIQETENSEQYEVKLAAVSSSQIPTPPRRSREFDLKTDLPNRTAYLYIPTFSYYNNVSDFREYIGNAFKEIKQKNSKNLIIDLRGNSGGDPHCSTYLYSMLIPEPLPYFAERFGGYESYADPLPVYENRFRGDLFILIDGDCFSTTGHITSLLKYHEIGTFIGEETGGTYTCNDASMDFTLRNTRFKGRVARMTFNTAVEMSFYEGVQPDHRVIPSAHDKHEERDAVMDYTMRLINRTKGFAKQ